MKMRTRFAVGASGCIATKFGVMADRFSLDLQKGTIQPKPGA